MDNNITLAEMLEKHGENAMKIRSFDMENLTAEEQNIVNEYVATRQLLQKTRESLDFVLATTIATPVEDNEYYVASLIEKVENVRALSTLTNGNDECFIKELYKEGLRSDLSLDQQNVLVEDAQSKINFLHKVSSFEQAYVNEALSTDEITVATLSKAVDSIQNLMADNEIGLDDIENNSLALLSKKLEEDSVSVYENAPDEIDTREEIYKQDDELVIVEGNDGGVMYTNMTPELAARRPDLLSKFESIVDTSGDFVTHYTVEETTTDMAKVGGDVKYEAVNDIGTIERGQGELNHEEKQAIVDDRQDEILAEQQRQQQIAYQEQLRLEEERRKQEQARQAEESKDEIIAGLIAGAMATAATVGVVKEITPVVVEAIKEAEASDVGDAAKPKVKNKGYDMER